MDDSQISRQNKYIIVYKMDDYYVFCDKNRYPTSEEVWV